MDRGQCLSGHDGSNWLQPFQRPSTALNDTGHLSFESRYGVKHMTFNSFPHVFSTRVCFGLDVLFCKVFSSGHNPFSIHVGYFIPQPMG